MVFTCIYWSSKIQRYIFLGGDPCIPAILGWTTRGKGPHPRQGWSLHRQWFSFLKKSQWRSPHSRLKNGYGSIPINTIFRGMNIHLPAILMFTRGTRFWHTAKWPLVNKAIGNLLSIYLYRGSSIAMFDCQRVTCFFFCPDPHLFFWLRSGPASFANPD